ncbi:MAG TPA: hypothetical protein VMT92_01780 [Steroidobacteraceae bacterium]|nr:hypothetical protein [Steroidobacteraceae bacterium]
MSPLWRDEVAIFLGPRKIAVARRERGLRPRVIAATDVAVPGGHFGDLRPTFARLAELLQEPTWQDAAARVVVADPWARYGVVPWPSTRLDAEGRLTHARYVLTDAFGDGLNDWAVTLADTPPGHAYVACAMPGQLRTALEDVLPAARLTLASLQPQLVVAFNAWRHRLPGDDTWFVSLDDGSLSAVHLSRGSWDRVHMARLSSDWMVELERLAAFGKLTRAAGAVNRMFIDAPIWMRHNAVPSGTELEWLDAVSGDGTQAHELALLQRVYA